MMEAASRLSSERSDLRSLSGGEIPGSAASSGALVAGSNTSYNPCSLQKAKDVTRLRRMRPLQKG